MTEARYAAETTGGVGALWVAEADDCCARSKDAAADGGAAVGRRCDESRRTIACRFWRSA